MLNFLFLSFLFHIPVHTKAQIYCISQNLLMLLVVSKRNDITTAVTMAK